MSTGPNFQNPPVVEVALGIQFDSLPGFTNAHHGLFWNRLGIEEWPLAEDMPPMPQQFERFGADMQWAQVGTINIGLSPRPSSRSRFMNATKDRVVQLQNGRLWYNWARTPGNDYPRYENALRQEAKDVFDKFFAFAAEFSLGEIHLNQWEVTYVNHFRRGTVWNDAADWTNIFNSNAMLPYKVGDNKLESFSGSWTYEIAQSVGRLHVDLHSGKDKPDGDDILVLRLTSRGSIPEEKSRSVAEAVDGLNVGHDIIVNGFRDLTSIEARAHWKEEVASQCQ
jgi:uncharacterized protein (TIGR04255 family)